MCAHNTVKLGVSCFSKSQYWQPCTRVHVHVSTWIHCSCTKVDLHVHTCIYMYTTTVRVVSWPVLPTQLYLYISYSLHRMLHTVNCMPSNATMYVYIHVYTCRKGTTQGSLPVSWMCVHYWLCSCHHLGIPSVSQTSPTVWGQYPLQLISAPATADTQQTTAGEETRCRNREKRKT